MDWMPHFHALLNSLSILLMGIAFRAIRGGRREEHRRFMLIAIGVMVVFVISYAIYHSRVGITPFAGQGWIRSVYYTILITHVLMAVVALPLVPTTLYLAWRGRLERHRRLARWTLPIWFYVSCTGLVVYGMVYHL